jgi:hypothetical protein
MKKMVLASAAIITAFALQADITSANVVGYMAAENGSMGQYTGGGSMFVTPGQKTYKLSDFSISGYTPNTIAIARAQYIQFFLPGSCKVDQARSYYNWQGKWYYKFTTETTTANAEAADFNIPAGTGFMCNFGKATTKLNFAGEVLQNSEGIAVGNTGAQYFFAYNPYPVPLKLPELSITGFTPNTIAIARAQYIQFMQKASCKVDQARSFYNWQGKWYYKFTTDTTTQYTEVTDFEIQPGEGFLCNFGKTTSVLNIPAFEIK